LYVLFSPCGVKKEHTKRKIRRITSEQNAAGVSCRASKASNDPISVRNTTSAFHNAQSGRRQQCAPMDHSLLLWALEALHEHIGADPAALKIL
jgi:hypothetical protein